MIIAQIGDVKSEIVFVRALGERILISKNLLVQLPGLFSEHVVSVGNDNPRGKQRLIELSGFREHSAYKH